MKKTPKLNHGTIQELPPLGRTRKVTVPEHKWSTRIPMLARAMVLTPNQLLVAGLADVLNEEDLNVNLNDRSLQARAHFQVDAWKGKQGGLLYSLSTTDGSNRSEVKLESPPVFDGMAAAGRKLHLSLTDGSVICLGAN